MNGNREELSIRENQKLINIEKQIKQEQDPLKRIELWDEHYKNRKRRLRKRKKKVCLVPGCEGEVVTLGLCASCRNKHYACRLIGIDPSTFNDQEEVIDLYRDIFAFAEENDLKPGEALAWLASEGLNSYERRMKKEKK